MDSFLSSELQRNLSSGIFDVHSIDDMELLSEHPLEKPRVKSHPAVLAQKTWETEKDDQVHLFPEPSMSPPRSAVQSRSGSPVRDSQDSRPNSRPGSPTRSGLSQLSNLMTTPIKEQEGRNGSLAKIKVVVRKRPLNRKEKLRKEDDVILIDTPGSMIVHEPKLKVDLTKYVDRHEFMFNAVLDEDISNDEVYRETVEPIVPYIFEKTKATCFAYGQTGSGKTYTMQPLPLRAAEDMVQLLRHPQYRSQNFQLWVSFFEIYGGKVYDLLNERRKLDIREDRRQQVCIVGLKEYRVEDVSVVKEHIERGGASRSTGSTGANEESSRSHAILQLVVKKHKEPERTRSGQRRSFSQRDEAEETGRMVGKFSFIDLAGSERGADTTDNDKQTRMEGAEINKSLLALKECIRALDHEASHIPFRGSKLTEVLRDSFVGNSRTVMVSCISPGSASVEHTLNTLRYADRVKGLSRSGSNPNGSASVLRSSANGLCTPLPPLPPGGLAPVNGQERDAGHDVATTKKSKWESGRTGRPGSIANGNDSSEGRQVAQPRGMVGSDASDLDASEVESGSEDAGSEVGRRGVGGSVPRRGRRSKDGEHDPPPRGGRGEGRITRSRAAAAASSPAESEPGAATPSASFAPIPGWPGASPASTGLASRLAKQQEAEPSGAKKAPLAASKAPAPASLLKPPTTRGPPPAQGQVASSQELPTASSRLPGKREGGSLVAGLGGPRGEAGSSLPQAPSRSSTRQPAGPSESWGGKRGAPATSAQPGGEGSGQPQREQKAGAGAQSIDWGAKQEEQERSERRSLPQEEELVILAHRKHIEETMELVRQEMRLLAELDQRDGQVQRYAAALSGVLARKAAGISDLQTQVASLSRHFAEVGHSYVLMRQAPSI